jgi:hypothetical protein
MFMLALKPHVVVMSFHIQSHTTESLSDERVGASENCFYALNCSR